MVRVLPSSNGSNKDPLQSVSIAESTREEIGIGVRVWVELMKLEVMLISATALHIHMFRQRTTAVIYTLML